MTIPHPPTAPSAKGRLMRRIVGLALLVGIFFVVLWMTIFNATTAAIVSLGLGGGVAVAGASSNAFGDILETILQALFGVLAPIGSAIAAVFNIFD